jgi:hypothetical protein
MDKKILAVVAAGTAVVPATEDPVAAVTAMPDTDSPVPVVVAAGTAVVPATEDPVPVVATEPAVVAAGTAVVTGPSVSVSAGTGSTISVTTQGTYFHNSWIEKSYRPLHWNRRQTLFE